MVVSVLLKIKFGHAQISVPKIGIPITKTACINPWYWHLSWKLRDVKTEKAEPLLTPVLLYMLRMDINLKKLKSISGQIFFMLFKIWRQ